MIVWAFHLPLDNLMQPINDFESNILDVVHKFKNNPNCNVFFCGDFNASDIDWDSTNTVHEQS